MKRRIHPIFMIERATFASWCLALTISLIWQHSHSAFAQTKPQILPAPAPKRVVLLYSYGDGIPAYQQATRGFLSVMKEGGVSVNHLFFEYLDLERKKDTEHKKNLVTLFRHKYEGEKTDLVVTVHTQALKFILSEGKNLFSGAPVLSFLAPDMIETPAIERQVLLLPMKMDFKGTLELALKLFPQTQRVVFINGVGEGEKRLAVEAKSVFVQWRDKLEFEYTDNLSVEEMLERIANLPSRTIVFYSNVFRDKTGRTFVPRDVAEMVAKAANAPVFGMYNTILGSGIVGGSMFNFEAEGARAAAVALDILKGNRSLTQPVTILAASRIPMFDWPQLKRWDLDESALPPESIVLNRPALVWKEHILEIISILAFCLFETALIIFLIAQRRRKKLAEQSLWRKKEELDQFFNVSLDLLCVANTDGYFLRLNPVWEEVVGYTREELTAKRFLEFVHPDDLDRTRKAIDTLVLQQQVTFFENRYRCKDGTYRWLQWSSAPAGKLIYAAARDVTERKQAEQDLKERLRFEQLLSDLSARFVNVPSDRADSEIEKGLGQILAFFKVERCGLIQVWPEKAAWMVVHVTLAYDIPSPPVGVEFPISIVPWVYDKLIHKGETVAVSRLDDLPPEANKDKQTWIEWGVQSGMYIPVMTGEPGSYVIAIDSMTRERVWSEEYVPRLRLLGEVLVGALERKRAEAALQEGEKILRQNENDLRRLTGRLISAHEEERSRIARELHDDLAQRLAVFAIDVGKIEQQLTDSPAPVQEKLRGMKEDVVKISQDVHNLSRQLHPSILDDLGLIKAVESECTNFSRREGIDIAFNHENISSVIPNDVSLSLYRIIQEGLRNISKHACAEHISVSLRGIDHDVFLSVQDDGIGFDLAEVKEKPGLGLSSMRERARLIHGELSVQSQPERGTLITVRVPLTREGE